jgi:signal transduction histidine kinase/CheY-like chemotaxis protein/HPt (histidine-containing phosphotransfer) domain-containing protein
MFTENAESVMHSGSLLIVNALLRNESMLRIQEASAQLESALDDAKEANEAKSNFLAHMSHEIRTPLNAVVGLSELALSDDQLKDDTQDKLEKIHNSGMTILSIINDILDISKIESGKFELYRTQYDTPSLINDIITLNIVRIGEKPIEFKLFVDKDLPAVLYGDDLRVKQIFNNLLSNAFKYTDSGTVEWHIAFERDEEDVWLVSRIKDTGAGIKPEDLEKLFSEYAQVDKESNRKVEGTGLGLAITKRLTDMMEGTIALESEYGKGTTVSVRLRQSYVSEVVIGKSVADSLMSLKYTLSKRAHSTKLTRLDLSYASVLVVDDIATNLDVVKGMLTPYKLRVDSASSGKQAIEMVRRGTPRYSAVFMDHMMPGMDGIEATRIIREDIGTEYARRVPIIALTANAIVGNEEMFLNKGFQAFVSKPIDTAKLDAVLRQWVRNKDAEKDLSGTNLLGAETTDANAFEDEGKQQPIDDEACACNEGSLLADITIDGMDKGRALKRFGCDEAVLLNVLRSYAKNTLLLLDNLDECLAKNQISDYCITIHGIKGSSYSIFTNEVGKMAAGLETAAKNGDVDTVRFHHDDFVKCTKALIEDIKEALLKVDAKIKKPLVSAPDPGLLVELRDACKKFDISLVNTAMAKLESFRYESGEELIEWLHDRISDMDFEEIATMDISQSQSVWFKQATEGNLKE